MKKKLFALVAAMSLTSIAMAQSGSIGTITVDPASPVAGQPVTVTINADGEAPGFCGLRVEYGESTQDFKIDDRHHQFPLVTKHTYAKPGTYVITARGKSITTHGRCQGQAEAKVTVMPAARTLVCPDGYRLKRGVGNNAETFTCTARKAMKKREQQVECKEGMEYFQTKTSFGCRAVKP